MRITAAFAAAVPALLAAPTLAQVIDWAAANNGPWGTAGNWNPQNVPDNANETARLALGSPYTVTLNNTFTIGALNITNAGAILDIPSTRSLTLSDNSAINGLVRLNSDKLTNTAFLKFEGHRTLSGTGELRLFSNGGDAKDATLAAQSNDDTLTIANGFTIRGSGRIVLPVTNNGFIIADGAQGSAFEFFGDGAVNNNMLIKAVGATTLAFNSTTVDQTDDGVIQASEGSVIELTLTTFTGGSFHTDGDGVFRTTPGSSHLAGVTNFGRLEVMDGTDLTIDGVGLVNNGEIVVNPKQGAVPASITFEEIEEAAFTGDGSITLNAKQGDFADARLAGFDGAANASDHTLGGVGRIDGSITNHGILAPGTPVGTLVFTIGPWVQADDGTLLIRLAGPNPGEYGACQVSGAVEIDGTLKVELVDGYMPSVCDPYVIIDAVNTVKGTFDEIIGPDVGEGVWRAVYKDDSVELVLTCYADMEADCKLDLFDFLEFVNLFNLEAIAADCDEDGTHTLFDFLCFVNRFNAGC